MIYITDSITGTMKLIHTGIFIIFQGEQGPAGPDGANGVMVS